MFGFRVVGRKIENVADLPEYGDEETHGKRAVPEAVIWALVGYVD